MSIEQAWERAPALVDEIVETRRRLAVLFDERELLWRTLVDGGERKSVVARAFGVTDMRVKQTLDQPRKRAS